MLIHFGDSNFSTKLFLGRGRGAGGGGGGGGGGVEVFLNAH